jgi:hypothetical protein
MSLPLIGVGRSPGRGRDSPEQNRVSEGIWPDIQERSFTTVHATVARIPRLADSGRSSRGVLNQRSRGNACCTRMQVTAWALKRLSHSRALPLVSTTLPDGTASWPPARLQHAERAMLPALKAARGGRWRCGRGHPSHPTLGRQGRPGRTARATGP